MSQRGADVKRTRLIYLPSSFFPTFASSSPDFAKKIKPGLVSPLPLFVALLIDAERFSWECQSECVSAFAVRRSPELSANFRNNREHLCCVSAGRRRLENDKQDIAAAAAV